MKERKEIGKRRSEKGELRTEEMRGEKQRQISGVRERERNEKKGEGAREQKKEGRKRWTKVTEETEKRM